MYEIEGREGLYRETATLMSKYERRGTVDNLDKLSYAQFCKEYDSCRTTKKKKQDDDDHSSASEVEDEEGIEKSRNTEEVDQEIPFHDRIHVADDSEIYKLPKIIKLQNVDSSEASCMKRKKIPNAIRSHKIKDKNSHEWLYSQLLLYRPFQNETLDLQAARESKDICEDLFLYPSTVTSIAENKDDLRNSYVIKVRQKVMPFIEDVEEAREKIAVLNTEKIGEDMDAENEQENEECNIIGDEVHPDYETQHPDFFFEGNVPPKNQVSTYRKVDLWDTKTIRTEIRKLDSDQRYVLDHFIKYARTLKLAEKGFCAFPEPPLLVVEGDAGSGKSELINNLCQVLEKEF